MRVLVTGSSGFIGRHLAQALLDRGDEVLAIDKRPPAGVTPFRFEQCDIVDNARLDAVVTSFAPEIVLHLAARTDIDPRATVADYPANVVGVANLIAAIRASPSVRRAVFTSTQLVCRVGYKPASDEDYAPNNVYGESKVLTEKIVRREDGGGVTWCIVRPTTVWGPGMSEHYQRFLAMLRKGTYFHIGKRPLMKSFGYVGNVVHQYLRIVDAARESVHRQTFYIADYEPLALQTWANALAEKFGSRRVRTLPVALAHVAATIGDVVNAAGFRRFPFNSFRLNNVLTEYTFDLSNTRRVCGELPYSLDEAARVTAEWFVKRH